MSAYYVLGVMQQARSLRVEGTPVSWSSLGASASRGAASEDSHLLNKTEKENRIRPRSQEGSPVAGRAPAGPS